MDTRYTIDDVALIGRTFEEYRRMFDLRPGSLAGQRVLDCPGGTCSFVAAARDRGIDAVAADVAYGPPVEALREQGEADVDRAMDALDGVEHLYRWDHYDDVADLRSYRDRALDRFCADYGDGGPYVAAALPSLPFETNAFDRTLSGHFLFLYDDRLDESFHRAALRELVRVTSEEVRVFPLVRFDTEVSESLAVVRADLHDTGVTTEVRSVPFEFQRGATEMLVVTP